MREASTALLVDEDQRSNVTTLLRERVEADPQHALYARKGNNGWANITGRQFLSDVTGLAKGLIAGGLGTGDPVAVMSRTSYEWTVADFAIWWAGGVTVPIYETSSISQIEWILADSGARRVLVEDPAAEARVQQAIAGSAALPDDPFALTRMDYDGAAPNFASLAAVGRGVSDDELERHRATAGLSDVASIVYTSGTTGRPKGCEITHGNFVLVARNVVPFLPELLLRPGARTLMFLPLAHVLARAVQVVCLASGVTLGHSPGAERLLADLSSFKPTFLLAVPRIFEKVHSGSRHQAALAGKSRLFAAAADAAVAYSRAQDEARRGAGTGPGLLARARHAVFEKLLYPRIRSVFGGSLGYAVSGASPLGADLAHFFTGAGIPVLQGYGLTETTAPCTVNTPTMMRAGSVGIPLPGTTVRIAEDGEVLVKGIGVFRGYHGDATATDEAFVDGFFRTGDLGSLDDEGFLTITGRTKDLLVTAGGKNVAPGPLEDRINAHPLVGHAVVVGDGRPFVAALIDLDPEGLREWCEERGITDLEPAGAVDHPDVRAAVQGAVDEANTHVSQAESIRSFAVLNAGFSVESGHLTPSLKLRRAAVVADFGDEIEKLYRR